MFKKAFVQFTIVAIAVVGLSLLYFFYPVSDNRFYPKCIFHSLTGFDCPGCGSQRAFSALLHGRILEALDYNLLFVLSIPFIAFSAFVFSWNVFSKKKMKQQIFYSPIFVWVTLSLVISFWVVRNIPASPFTWLKS